MQQIELLLETSQDVISQLETQIKLKKAELETLTQIEKDIATKGSTCVIDKRALQDRLDACNNEKQTYLQQKQALVAELLALRQASSSSTNDDAAKKRLEELEIKGRNALALYARLADSAETIPQHLNEISTYLENVRREISEGIANITNNVNTQTAAALKSRRQTKMNEWRGRYDPMDVDF